MKIGDWIIAMEDTMFSWANKHKDNIWNWPIYILIHIIGFLVFQLSNLFAQIRWPFSAVIRFIKSFRAIPSGEPIPANETTLQKLLKENRILLVDFWTEWCGPCVLMEGSLKEFAKHYEGKIVVAKVDATINPKLTKKYNVMGYPTLMIFFEGEEIGRITTMLNFKALVKLFEDFLEEV
jgi:thiol-disulfide isomerase/thioredoxin